MRVLCVFGQHNYGDPARGLSYEYANFIPAIERVSDEVHFFETWNRHSYRDFSELNRRLLETAEALKPDVIFAVLVGYEIWTETLDYLRRHCRSTLINWGTDDSWKFAQLSRWVAPCFDLHATTSPEAIAEAERLGIGNCFLSQWAASGTHLREPKPMAQCRYELSFIGSAYGNRPKWISRLEKEGLKVECFGHGWANGTVSAEQMRRIIRDSAISLNFGDSPVQFRAGRLYRSRQIKARVFEIPGSGGFLLTQDAQHLSDFYIPGQEIIAYRNADELVEQIGYYLSHPAERDAVARAGFERTVKDHTYEARFGRLFEAGTRAASQRIHSMSASDCRFDRQWFDRLYKRHAPGLLHVLIRRALVLLLSTVFGRHRGPRAARRLTYELSWRLVGARTYSATGWPGRLFYRES